MFLVVCVCGRVYLWLCVFVDVILCLPLCVFSVCVCALSSIFLEVILEVGQLEKALDLLVQF